MNYKWGIMCLTLSIKHLKGAFFYACIFTNSLVPKTEGSFDITAPRAAQKNKSRKMRGRRPISVKKKHSKHNQNAYIITTTVISLSIETSKQ